MNKQELKSDNVVLHYAIDSTEANPKMLAYIRQGLDNIHVGYVNGTNGACEAISLNNKKKLCIDYKQAKSYLLEVYKKHTKEEIKEQINDTQITLF